MTGGQSGEEGVCLEKKLAAHRLDGRGISMAQKKPTQAEPKPGQIKDEIEAMARAIYNERRSKDLPGDELSDWLAAEAAIKAKHKL
jgi:hypothetical protein